MHRLLRTTLAAALFVVSIACASSAFAVPVSWQSVHVALHQEQTGGVLLVSGILPDTTPLPAEAEISVPAGSQIQWIGEILGSDPSADPEVQYVKTSAGSSDVYRFTLTKARRAQIEILTSDPQAVDGTTYTSTLKWVSTQAVPEVAMSVRIPQGAKVLTPAAGATLEAGETGYSYYAKTVQGVKAGDALDLTFTYSAPVAAAVAGTSNTVGRTDPIVPMVIVGAVVVLLAAGAIAVRSRLSAKAVLRDSEEETSGAGRALTASAGSSEQAAKIGAAKRTTTSTGAASSPARRMMSPRARRTLVTVVIAGVLIVLTVVVGQATSKPQLSGDTITQTFAQGQPCATVDIALTAPSAAEPAGTAEKLFAALQPVTGLNTATYNAKTSSIQLGFCESVTSEAALRSAMQPTGFVVAGAPSTTPPAGSAPATPPVSAQP